VPIVGLDDLFGVIQSATVDLGWVSQFIKLTGHALAAAAFSLVCFSRSALIEQPEQRLRGAHSGNAKLGDGIGDETTKEGELGRGLWLAESRPSAFGKFSAKLPFRSNQNVTDVMENACQMVTMCQRQ
jgi:hypothetical protein